LTFDGSTLEIYGALLNGSTLAIVGDPRSSLEELSAAISAHGVTMAWLSSGLFHQWVDSHLEGLRPLRQGIAGGDVVSPSHARRLLLEVPSCELYNGYGPTENSGFTSAFRVPGAASIAGAIPIGRPLGNTTVYVLDRGGQPAPLGAPGEICSGED